MIVFSCLLRYFYLSGVDGTTVNHYNTDETGGAKFPRILNCAQVFCLGEEMRGWWHTVLLGACHTGTSAAGWGCFIFSWHGAKREAALILPG